MTLQGFYYQGVKRSSLNPKRISCLYNLVKEYCYTTVEKNAVVMLYIYSLQYALIHQKISAINMSVHLFESGVKEKVKRH